MSRPNLTRRLSINDDDPFRAVFMLTGGAQGSGKGTDKSAARSIDARKPM